MKHTLKLIPILFCCITMSCGQRNAEQDSQALQHHDDSLRAAIEGEINTKLQGQNDSLKAALSTASNTASQSQNNNTPAATAQQAPNAGAKENELINAKFELNRLSSALVNAKASLEAARADLLHAEQFHIGRTTAMRDMEVRNQDLRVQGWQNAVQKIYEAILEKQGQINSLQNDTSQAN